MVRHTDLEMSIMKEEILALRLLAAEGMATMQLPMERQGMGQEEEKPGSKAMQSKAFRRSTGKAGTGTQPFSGPALGRRLFGLI